jgi:hypothetical protein
VLAADRDARRLSCSARRSTSVSRSRCSVSSIRLRNRGPLENSGWFASTLVYPSSRSSRDLQPRIEHVLRRLHEDVQQLRRRSSDTASRNRSGSVLRISPASARQPLVQYGVHASPASPAARRTRARPRRPCEPRRCAASAPAAPSHSRPAPAPASPAPPRPAAAQSPDPARPSQPEHLDRPPDQPLERTLPSSAACDAAGAVPRRSIRTGRISVST